MPYYVAREKAAKCATRFVGTPPRARGSKGKTGNTQINGHGLDCYRYGNTVSYYLRLPDGGFAGDGYPATGFQSLKNLHDGAIATISNISGTETYGSWLDLVATLQAIVAKESAGSSEVWIHVHDPDASVNASDHSDHMYTGQAMIDAVSTFPCIHLVKYLDYVTGSLPANLSEIDARNEAAIWGVTASSLIDSRAANLFEEGFHNTFLGRNYYSIVHGSGPCGF